jgi:methyl-accepting chemotaxis protein
MTIGRKLGLAFGLALGVLILIGWVAYRNTARLIETSDRVAHSHRVRSGVRDVFIRMLEVESGGRGYVLDGDESLLAPYRAAVAAVEQDVKDLATLTADNPRQQSRLQSLKPLISEKVEFTARLNRVRKEKGFEAAAQLFREGTGLKLQTEIGRLIDETKSEEDETLKQRDAEARRTADATFRTISYGTALAVLAVLSVGFLITRSITVPVRRLTEGARRLGEGKLEHHIDVAGRDELGNLGSAFNHMAGELRTTIETEKKGREQLERLLAAIAETASSLASATAEILAGTAQQVAGAEEQAASVAETVATVDEVVQTSEQASQRARAVADSSQRAVEVGKAGRRAVEETVGAMGAVKDRAESTAGSILALAEQAQAIGEIIATVNDIAEQTNLLALNAAIEASRAGEQGKGFGVVAGEIKALADQSKKATGQVRQILGEIQKATNSAVMATEEGSKSVSAGIRAVDQAGETIRALADTISEAAQAAAQIAASAGQQATGMAQIHQAMKNISQATNQSLASTRQSERAAQDLSTLGEKLKHLLAGSGR